MPCIALPAVAAPDLSILLPSLNITIPAPHVGISLCCELSTPPVAVTIPPIASLGVITTILAGANAAIASAVDELNGLLDSIQVSCPLE